MNITWREISMYCFFAALFGLSATGCGDDRASDNDDSADADTDDELDVCAEIECGDPHIVFVDSDSAAPALGNSWETAFRRVRDGLERCYCIALDCDTTCQVWVAEGTYHIYESSANDTVLLRPGVELYGGFAGTESLIEERDWAARVTTLDGRKDVSGSAAVYHVVTGSDLASIDGFTIARGRADAQGEDFSPPEERSGGGMYNSYSSPIVTNCVFQSNFAAKDGAGGGMYNFRSSPTVTNCSFLDNEGEEGAGMHNEFSHPAVVGCTFAGNRGEGTGGGMNNLYSSPTVKDCVFENNFSAQSGGGMYNYDSSPVLTNCVFAGNEVVDGYPLWDYCGTGGGMYNIDSSPILTNCAFFDNSTYSESSHDCAGTGGGMCNERSYPSLFGCTFTANRANQGGGGIFNGSNSAPRIDNSVFWGNAAELSGDELLNDPHSLPILRNSDIRGCGGSGAWVAAFGTDLGGNLDADPLFADAAVGHLTLTAGSPCIDTGDDNLLPADAADLDGDGNTEEPLPLDLAGNPRSSDGDSDGTATVDIGAYEF